MYARVQILRRGGRKIPDHEQSHPEHRMVGCLEITGSKCILWRTGSMVWPPMATLHSAQVLSVIGDEMFIRGFEEWNGAGVLQEWRCSVMSGPEFHSPASR